MPESEAISAPAWRTVLWRLAPWLVGLAIAAKAGRHAYQNLLLPLFSEGFDGQAWSYTAAQNQLNWLTTGFTRRELYNTVVGLAGLAGANPMVSNAVVFLVFYTLLAGVLIWAIVRRAPGLHQVALAAVAVGLLFRLSLDVGRPDAAVVLCALLAAWAARAGRWVIAAAAISIALAVHETGMIFLAPLVCAIAWEDRAWRVIDRRSAALGGTVMAVGLGLYVVGARAQLDTVALANRIHAQFPGSPWADLATYFNLAGFRTIRTTWCEIPLDPKYGMQLAAGAGLLSLLSVAVRPRRWRVTLIAVLTPFLFTSFVATDAGRWAMLGVAVILALAVTQPAVDDRLSWKPAAICAALAIVGSQLMVQKVGSLNVGAPIPWVNALERFPSMHTLPSDEAVAACDPAWRQYLGLPGT